VPLFFILVFALTCAHVGDEEAPQQRDDAVGFFTPRGEGDGHEGRGEDAEVEEGDFQRGNEMRREPARPGQGEDEDEEERHVRTYGPSRRRFGIRRVGRRINA